jgi:hypothetical protein
MKGRMLRIKRKYIICAKTAESCKKKKGSSKKEPKSQRVI